MEVNTIAADIYSILIDANHHEHSNELAAEHAMRIGGEFAKACKGRDQVRHKGKLWASDIGKPCMRQHWYNFNWYHEKEELNGWTKFKFLYGNIIEEAALYYAREAGHTVQHLQAPVSTSVGDWSVSGRIDAGIDSSLCDVKSTSTFAFNKYKKEGINSTNDTFGYLYQVGFYFHFNELSPELTECGFLWVDKQNGHIMYEDVTDKIPSKSEILFRIDHIIAAVEGTEKDAPKLYSDVPEGKSGNMKLGTECSYCAFKEKCWEDSNGGKGLRTFLYSNKPVYLTQVVREPRVPELFASILASED